MLRSDSRSLPGLLFFSFALYPAVPSAGEVWRSPLHDQTFLRIEKRLSETPGIDGTAEAAPLPADLLARLGENRVDYESFVTAYLSDEKAQALAGQLAADGWLFHVGIDRRVELPWHSFVAGDHKRRDADFSASGLTGRPVPGLYLLQFAYPVMERWLDDLSGCGLERLAALQQRAILVRAGGLSTILACPAARYLS